MDNSENSKSNNLNMEDSDDNGNDDGDVSKKADMVMMILTRQSIGGT